LQGGTECFYLHSVLQKMTSTSSEDRGANEVERLVGEIAVLNHRWEALRTLCGELEGRPPTGATYVVDDFARHQLHYSALNVKKTIEHPIKIALTSFISDQIYKALEDNVPACHRSAKHAAQLFVASTVRHVLVESFVRGWMEGMISNVDRALLDEHVLNEIDCAWRTHCEPLIEAERESLQEDIFDMQRAWRDLNTLQKRIGALGAEGPVDEASSTALSKAAVDFERRNGHVFERIRLDDWMLTSRQLWKPGTVAKTCQCDFNTFPEVFNNLHAMLVDAQTNLSKDLSRLQKVVEAPSDSAIWHGIRVEDHVDDPTDGFILMNPTFTSFESSTGRIYVRLLQSMDGASCHRGIVALQMAQTVREIVSHGWLGIGKTSVDYALQLAKNEYNTTVFAYGRMQDILKGEMRNADMPCDAKSVEELVRAGSKKQAYGGGGGGDGGKGKGCKEDAGSDSADTASASSTSLLARTPAPSASTPAQYVSNVCLPSQEMPYRPECVDPDFLVDYITIYTALCRVAVAVESRRHGAAVDVHITTKELVATVDCRLNSQRRRLRHDINESRLAQIVPVVVRKLLEQGKRGCEKSPRSVNWDATFEPSKRDRTMRLNVGRGSHDAACVAFCNVCSSLMFYLSSNWPLPLGMQWNAPRVRPPRKPKARSGASTSHSADGEDQTGVGGEI